MLLPEIEPLFLGRVAYSKVTVLTELHRSILVLTHAFRLTQRVNSGRPLYLLQECQKMTDPLIL